MRFLIPSLIAALCGTVSYSQTTVVVGLLEQRAIEGNTGAMYQLGKVLLTLFQMRT